MGQELIDIPDKIIIGDETRLYRVKTVLDHLGKSLDFSNCFIKSPVPVMSEDSRNIGFASLSIDSQNRLIGELTLDYATEERLLIETQEVKLYPNCSVVEIGLDSHSSPRSLILEKVILSRKCVDNRLKPLGEIVL